MPPIQSLLVANTTNRCLPDTGCVDIGPWDCHFEELAPSPEAYMTVEQCCDLIHDEMPFPDVHGNTLQCYASPPPAYETDNVDLGRVILHVSQDNKVVHEPKNG